MAQRSKQQDAKILEKVSKIEKTWKLIMIICLGVTSMILVKSYFFCQDTQTQGICQFKPSDFTIAAMSTLFFGIIRIIFFTCLKKPIADNLIDKEKYTNDEAVNLKADIYCKWILDVFQYSLLAVCEYLLLKDTDFLPSVMFGKGSTSNIYGAYPNQEFIPYQKEFYMVSLGIHAVSLLYQLSGYGHNKKYYEFMLHHYMALFLILFSYICNFMRVGLLVLITHDIGDVFISLGRLIIEMNHKVCKILKYPVSGLCVIIWIYSRLFAFPFYVIKPSIEFWLVLIETRKELVFFGAYLVIMLLVLVVMHLYWTIPMLKFVIQYFFLKKKEATVYYERPQINEESETSQTKKDIQSNSCISSKKNTKN